MKQAEAQSTGHQSKASSRDTEGGKTGGRGGGTVAISGWRPDIGSAKPSKAFCLCCADSTNS